MSPATPLRLIESHPATTGQWEPLLQNAERIITTAIEEHRPRAIFGLFSGGNDSSVTAHVAHRLLGAQLGGLAHIDTGTAIPGVKEFAHSFAVDLGVPMVVYDAHNAYEQMVLGGDDWWEAFNELRGHEPGSRRASVEGELTIKHGWRYLKDSKHPARGRGPFGFPGPGAHSLAYIRLKERQVDALVRDYKPWSCRRCDQTVFGGDRPEGCPGCGGHMRKTRTDRIMLLTGVRDAESARRMGAYAEIERDGAQVWVAPLISWSNDAMRSYRADFGLRQSDVAAMIHRSGECNCGAFAAPGERAMLKSIYPEWFAWIEGLEAEAERRGIANCVWGERPKGGSRVSKRRPGPMCHGCVQQQLALEAA